MRTQTEIRESFWRDNPHLAMERQPHKRQNHYRCDIRCAFVDYVDTLQRNGEISDALADRVTL